MLLIHELPGSPQESTKSCAEASSRLDEVLGIRSAAGAFVVSIDPGSPAELAGLDVCDLIAGLKGRDFRNYGNAAAFLGALRDAGMFSGAELEVWRMSDPGRIPHHERLKLRIPLQAGAKIGASVTFQVLVLEVVTGSPADSAGVQAGEFIDEVDGQKVSEMRSIGELDQRISEAAKQGDQVLLTLSRWKPVRGSADYKSSYVTRDVVVRVGN